MLRPCFWGITFTVPQQHLLLLLLLLLIIIIMHLPQHTSADVLLLSSDKQALLDFAAAVPHPRSTSNKLNWINQSSSSVCRSWTGVTCTTTSLVVNGTSTRRVLELRLPGSGFSGPIPRNTLGRLHALASLSLRSNRLSGTLPSDILSLPSLRYLYLQRNNFSGHIIPIPLPPPSQLSPQLTFIDLSFNSFSGPIPSQLFANLTRLAGLNLQNNLLTGPIPQQLGLLPALVHLNLSNNNFNGSIPPSLQHLPASSFQGNSLLCGRPLDRQCINTTPAVSPSIPPPSIPPLPSLVPPESPHVAPPPLTSLPPASSRKHINESVAPKLSTAAIVPIVVGSCALLVLLVMVTVIICCSMNNKTKRDSERSESAVLVKVKALSGGRNQETVQLIKDIEELGEDYFSRNTTVEAENNNLVFFLSGESKFDLEGLLSASAEVLGGGGCGTTYKAILEDGTAVAVKRLVNEVALMGRKEFEQHIRDKVWRVNQQPHPNVVSLQTFYFSKDEKLLVYDFLPFGSLSTLLHGTAKGESGRIRVDWNSRVKIAVGAARGIAHIHSVGSRKLSHGNIKSTNVLLTQDLSGCISDLGCVIPSARKYSQMSDVYSFGVVLLELLTRKAPALDLPRWVQSVVREEWTAEVFDVELVKQHPNTNTQQEDQMVEMLQIAMACVARDPRIRPNINQVVRMIHQVPTH